MTLSANTVWELRTDGDDNNGGGFVTGASGSDYSQQAAAQLTVTDAATSGTTVTTLTSATGGFTSAMVGSIIHLYSGTNLTAGWYEITAYTDTNTVTLDRAPDDGVGGVSAATCKVGGALASIGGLGAVVTGTNQGVEGQWAYIRSGTYNLTGTTVNVSGGPLDLATGAVLEVTFTLKGYDSANGRDSYEGAKPEINVNGNAPTNVIKASGTFSNGARIQFIRVDADSQNISACYFTTADETYCHFYKCEAVNGSTTTNMFGFQDCKPIECYAEGWSVGFKSCGTTTRCYAKDCTTGFDSVSIGLDCIASGGTTGWTSMFGTIVARCSAYGNQTTAFSGSWGTCYIDCVAFRPTSGGTAFSTTDQSLLVNCASNGNWTNRVSDVVAIDHDAITLTADPFTDAANDDFSLNDVAGGGALLRAAGLSTYGQTGYADVGAVQHDAGGGSNVFVIED